MRRRPPPRLDLLPPPPADPAAAVEALSRLYERLTGRTPTDAEVREAMAELGPPPRHRPTKAPTALRRSAGTRRRMRR